MVDGSSLVAKWSPSGGLAVEGAMLSHLLEKTALPVPRAIYCSDILLIMEFVPNGGSLDAMGEEGAAEQLAGLHQITATAFGFEWDTVIGMLPQPNPWQDNWAAFYRDQRLLVMGRIALNSGRIEKGLFGKLEKLCGKIDEFLPAHPKASLTHGDIWSGNLLCRNGRVAAYIDPAIYFADREVELAYLEFLSTFGAAFFERYHALFPIDPDYREARRDLYQIFPLLVHCQICGGGYPPQTEAIIDRYI